MKVFEIIGKGWDNKINFVDDNNVLVGFDWAGSCCESFGALLSKEPPTEITNWVEEFQQNGINPEGFNFDTGFFATGKPKDGFDDGGIVTFRLTKGDEQIFLTLFNSHNGYYSHGFKMDVGGKTIREDYI